MMHIISQNMIKYKLQLQRRLKQVIVADILYHIENVSVMIKIIMVKYRAS